MKHARQQPWLYAAGLRNVASVMPLLTDEARHVIRVLRCRSGDTITAFDGCGHTRDGRLEIEKKSTSLHFTEPLQQAPEPTRQFQLLLCLPNHVATFEEILASIKKDVKIKVCRDGYVYPGRSSSRDVDTVDWAQ